MTDDDKPVEPTEPTEPTTELATLVGKAVELIGKGTVSMADLLKALSPEQKSEPLPAVIPTAKEITTAQRAAVDRLPSVYGKVVPTERRALQPVEVAALVDEKQTLDEVKKMAEARLGDITVTVHNHMNVEVEANSPEGFGLPLRDGKGNYIRDHRAGAPDREQEFSREVRNGAASLNAEALKALVDAGDLEHEDYLLMTTQTRVLDENKVLLLLKKKPDLVLAIAKATVPGQSSTSMFLRKRR